MQPYQWSFFENKFRANQSVAPDTFWLISKWIIYKRHVFPFSRNEQLVCLVTKIELQFTLTMFSQMMSNGLMDIFKSIENMQNVCSKNV